MEIEKNNFLAIRQETDKKLRSNLQKVLPMKQQKDSSERKINLSQKRKLFISPSKDFLIFFSQTNFNNFNTIKYDTKQKKNTKLTLNRKQPVREQNQEQNKNQIWYLKDRKTLSITNSTESLTSNKKAFMDEQKLLRLKRQVDQIRKKYNFGKLRQSSTSLKRVNSEQIHKKSFFCPSNSSLNSSKQKTSILTPKNNKFFGKKILTRSIFSQKSNRLRLTQNNRVNTVEVDYHKNVNQKRKNSFEFDNSISQVDLNSQIQGFDAKKIFQFTFGSKVMMDFRNNQKLKIIQKPLL